MGNGVGLEQFYSILEEKMVFYVGDALKHYSLSPKEQNASPTNREFKLDQYLLHELKCSCGFSSKKKNKLERDA